MLIEQAIFASAQSADAAGYHLVAASAGLSDADARDLVHWGPSHDSLTEIGEQAGSCNFFPLASGAFCVAKTVAAGAEYSRRGGQQVRTWCLVVPAPVLARFANDPFALMRAAVAAEPAVQGADAPPGLTPMRLSGRAQAVDQPLLAKLARSPGARTLANLVRQAMHSERLVIVGPQSHQYLAGLMSCLPVEIRPQFSFMTGLKLSLRRPFRIAAAPDDSPALRRLARELSAEVLTLDEAARLPLAADPWAEFVEAALAESNLSRLALEVADPFTQRSAPELALATGSGADVVALPPATPVVSQEAARHRRDVPHTRAPADRVADGAAARFDLRTRQDADTSQTADEPVDVRYSPNSEERARGAKPLVGRSELNVQVLLEQLDDLAFEALRGDAKALAALVEFWPEALRRLGEDGVAESRQQYLRYGLSIIKQADGGGFKPEATLAALDVLCLLFPDDAADGRLAD